MAQDKSGQQRVIKEGTINPKRPTPKPKPPGPFAPHALHALDLISDDPDRGWWSPWTGRHEHEHEHEEGEEMMDKKCPEARSQVLRAFVSQGNTLHGAVVELDHDVASCLSSLRCVFTLNGEHHEVRVDVPDRERLKFDPEGCLLVLAKEIADAVAAVLFQAAGRELSIGWRK